VTLKLDTGKLFTDHLHSTVERSQDRCLTERTHRQFYVLILKRRPRAVTNKTSRSCQVSQLPTLCGLASCYRPIVFAAFTLSFTRKSDAGETSSPRSAFVAHNFSCQTVLHLAPKRIASPLPRRHGRGSDGSDADRMPSVPATRYSSVTSYRGQRNVRA